MAHFQDKDFLERSNRGVRKIGSAMVNIYRTNVKPNICIFNRTKEHGWSDKKSSVFKHFEQRSAWKEIVDLFQTGGEEVDSRQWSNL